MSERTTTGARSLSGRRAPLGWLPWAALGLLGLLGLVAFLVIRNVADAGDQPGVDVTNDRLGGATESGSSGTSGRGTLTAGAGRFYPWPPPGRWQTSAARR